jgi:GYF domain 2
VKWYYADGDKPAGPVTRAELEMLFSAGKISTNTLIVQEGMYDWVTYRDLKKTTQFLFAKSEKAVTPGKE